MLNNHRIRETNCFFISIMTFLIILEILLICIVGFYAIVFVSLSLFYTHCSIIYTYSAIIFFTCIIIFFSRIILVYYCKCCNLIGYSTRYLFIISIHSIMDYYKS